MGRLFNRRTDVYTRVRYTGGKVRWQVVESLRSNGIELISPPELEKKSTELVDHYFAHGWNL